MARLLAFVVLFAGCGGNLDMPAQCSQSTMAGALRVKVANEYASGKVMGLGDCGGFRCVQSSSLGCHEWLGRIASGTASRCQVVLFLPSGESTSVDVQGGAFCGAHEGREITLAPAS